MKIRFVALGALLALLPASAWAADPTPATPAATVTPAATASPDSANVRSQAVPAPPVAAIYTKVQTFEAGLQIGTTAAGASNLDFVKRVKCTVNPVALTTPGSTSLLTCAATGAVATDYANCALPIASAGGVVIKSVAAGTDLINIELVAVADVLVDVGDVALQCLVVR